MQNELPPESMDEILELIYSDQKLAACKRYLELNGMKLNDRPSLLESKKFIEQLTEELKAKAPERFTKSSSSGCGAAIVMWAAVFGSSVWCISDWMT